MDITEQLLEQVGELTRRLNDIENNAKTNDELPAQSIFNPNSKIRVVVGGVSQITTLQRIIDAAVLAAMPFIDRFILSNGFVLTGNNLTVNSGWKWFLSGILYTNSTDSLINIPFASSDHSRIDLIVATTAGVFTRVTGVESLGTPVAPALPAETLQATFLTVTSDSISNPEEPVISYEYVTRSEKRFVDITGEGENFILPIGGEGNYKLNGSIQSIAGCTFSDFSVYYGKEYILTNNQDFFIEILHDQSVDFPFKLIKKVSCLLAPGESIRFVFNNEAFEEIGVSVPGKGLRLLDVVTDGNYTITLEDLVENGVFFVSTSGESGTGSNDTEVTFTLPTLPDGFLPEFNVMFSNNNGESNNIINYVCSGQIFGLTTQISGDYDLDVYCIKALTSSSYSITKKLGAPIDLGVSQEYVDAIRDELLDGVPTAGNTLQKLYNLISGAGSESAVANLAARNAFNVPHLPYSIFVTDDGDGNWAKYQATSTGVGATFVKVSDPDLLNAVMSAAAIKTAYESNSNTNAFTNALLSKLNAIAAGATANSTDAYLLARANQTGTQPASTISDFSTAVWTLLGAQVAAVIAETATDGSTSSGTASTYSTGVLIDAAKIFADTTISAESILRFTGNTASRAIRLYINDTNDLSGTPILIGQWTNISSLGFQSYFQRFLRIKVKDGTGAGTEVMSTSNTTTATEFGTVNSTPSTLAINWNTNKYLVAAVQCTSGSDTAKITMLRAKR